MSENKADNDDYDSNSKGLGTHALADLLLSQSDIGTMIKTDGEESNSYAFLSI
jgi:hypothetical protein